ncbi:MAG TPA: Uma2 family endonuclease [Pilimelia sp.]|nr:Uma2 family endonuclease [Pilimelia sp.]
MTRSTYRWRPPERTWTEQDLRGLPDDGQRYEIVDGCLHATPPLADAHQGLVDEILGALRSAAPPGWRPVARVGVQIGESYVMPDAVVLRPGTQNSTWTGPSDVALVIEVESTYSRRFDRYLKPSLYAEAGIEPYWRIECTCNGPVAHLYERPGAGQYRQHRSIQAGHCVVAELPYAVQVAPATWV